MKLRLRIDADDDDNVIQFLKPYYAYVLVHHVLPHGNPHYHAYVDDKMSLSIDAFRARVKRYFKTQKSSDYSVKKCDDDKVNEYVQYLFNTKHGNTSRLVTTVNFDDELLVSLQKSAQDVSDDYEQRTRTREKLNKGPTIFQLGVELKDMLDSTHVNDDITISDYSRGAIAICHKHHKSTEPNMLIKIVSTAMSFKQPDRLVKKVQEYFREV